MHTFVKNLNLNGINACIMPKKGGYNGIVRRQNHLGNSNPSVRNEYFFFILDEQFKLVEIFPMKDTSNRQTHLNFTTGIEDARFANETFLFAVTLDTNSRWKTEMSRVQIHSDTKDIIAVKPLSIEGFPNQNEKNWIFIEENEIEYTMLYSCNPLRIVSINKETGKGVLKKEYSISGIETEMHTGSVLKLDDGYLVTTRVKVGHSYKHSRWMRFNNDFDIISYSQPFRFHVPEKYVKTKEPLEYNTGSYEMCMSLHREGEEIVACLSVDDKEMYIYKYNLEDLLNLCNIAV